MTDTIRPHRLLDRASLLQRLRQRKALLRDMGATALYMFGSRARGDNRPDSDLDLFIDFDRNTKVPNLIDLIRLEQELSGAFGIPVTIATRDALHPMMRRQIEHDAVKVL